jgi:hypothetical protein
MADPLADAIRSYSETLHHQHQSFRAWQRLPLAEKSKTRAGGGAWLLTFCAYLAVTTRGELPWPVLLLPALLGVAWLAAGIPNALNTRDVISGMWWGIAALGWGALLIKGLYPDVGGPLAVFVLQGVYIASLAASATRCWLALRPVPQTKLPHPSKIGLPSGGLASPAAAHAALTRGGTRPWWRFW